ncbi:MAG: isoprenylcysteine carboxylmethyltransferase family protein [Gammaproteobacteria bacterium]|nr:isoprenylcysteine carboxylmethyltransferase family protein [Gammaproteobacteria bacterium]
MNTTEISRFKLLVMAVTRLGLFLVILFGLILGIAGQLSYWQAWMYLFTLLIPMIVVLAYLLVYDPALLARRMQYREKEAQQKLIIKLGSALYIFIYLVPALDQRFSWSEIPAWVSIIADGFVLFGYLVFFQVLRVNSYASRTIEVMEGQKLVSTGLYGIVRHPMYVGNIMMFVATPIALGSLWGLIPIVPFIGIMVYRILNEESVLVRDLPGYSDYQNQVRYRLIPGVW